ncbi:beta strand repeat-containing protein [Treponema primitia]|uniref:beta strand repeat-containing protein n=1 Tax=Treponema primitia TaxID=88058 RepID=UPI0002554D89|nr:nuclease [Treponema primitia]
MKKRYDDKNSNGAGKILPFLFLLTLMMVTACPNPFQEKSHNPGADLSPGMGRVVVQLGDRLPGRTILPLTPVFTKYTLTFSAAGKTAVTAELTAASDISGLTGIGYGVDLDPGVWTLTIDAYVGDKPNYTLAGKIAAPVSVTVTAGVITDYSASLVPLEIDGITTGTFSWRIVLPTLGDYEKATLILTKTTGDIPPVEVALKQLGTPVSAGDVVTDTQELPSGYYTVSVLLEKDGKDAGRSEVAHIYPGLTTAAEFNFTDAVFVSRKILSGTVGTITPGPGMTLTGTTIRAYADEAYTEQVPTFPSTVTVSGGSWTMRVLVEVGVVYFKLECSLSVGGLTGVYGIAAGNELSIPETGINGIAIPPVTISGIEAHRAADGGIFYGTLQKAIDNSTGTSASDLDTITLLTDLSLTASGELITIPTGKHVKLISGGSGGTRTISRGASGLGSLITVESNATLELLGSSTTPFVLDGGGSAPFNRTATDALVKVNGGKFTLGNNVTLQNNINTSGSGGGVYLADQLGSTFKKTGGTIYGDTVAVAVGFANSTTPINSGNAIYVGGSSNFLNLDCEPGTKLYAEYDGTTWIYTEPAGAGSLGDTGAAWVEITTWAQLDAAITAVADNTAVTEATIILRNDFTLASADPVIVLNVDKTITLMADSSNRTIKRADSLPYTNPIFTVEDGTLILGGGDDTGTLTLSGNGPTISDAQSPLIKVDGGTFEMTSDKVLLRDNSTATLTGGGVYVADGTFTMEDGTISGNSTTQKGGGVYVADGGVFNMSGGTISGNTANLGQGVYVFNGGTFNMDGGDITYNIALNNMDEGGGVYVAGGTSSGTFTMSGGNITYNSVPDNSNGGGVYVASGGTSGTVGTFTMSGGNITNNSVTGTGSGSGGGVYVAAGAFAGTGGNFTMSGGTISDNSTIGTGDGGGVFVNTEGTFTMEDGTIFHNSTAGNGGGVAVVASATPNTGFTMTGGIIGGSTDDKKNTAASGGGVYLGGSGGTFTMSGTAKIAGNTATGGGGGVYVADGGTSETGGNFIMSGGTISNNSTTSNGGGVYVAGTYYSGTYHYGTFTMSGTAEIAGNTATSPNSVGGGVYVVSGDTPLSTTPVFTMTGGIIGGSTDDKKNTAAAGGGGYFTTANITTGGTFTMSGNAKIIGNEATAGRGGGVVVDGTVSAPFIMDGSAEITGNKATDEGGGVYVQNAFSMKGSAKIEGNSVVSGSDSQKGFGVYLSSSTSFCTFAMEGNAIVATDNKVYFDNTASPPKYLTLSGALTSPSGTIVANLDPQAPSATNQVLAEPLSSGFIAAYYDRFLLNGVAGKIGTSGQIVL